LKPPDFRKGKLPPHFSIPLLPLHYQKKMDKEYVNLKDYCNWRPCYTSTHPPPPAPTKYEENPIILVPNPDATVKVITAYVWSINPPVCCESAEIWTQDNVPPGLSDYSFDTEGSYVFTSPVQGRTMTLLEYSMFMQMKKTVFSNEFRQTLLNNPRLLPIIRTHDPTIDAKVNDPNHILTLEDLFGTMDDLVCLVVDEHTEEYSTIIVGFTWKQ
jgi:hypothetical protein